MSCVCLCVCVFVLCMVVILEVTSLQIEANLGVSLDSQPPGELLLPTHTPPLLLIFPWVVKVEAFLLTTQEWSLCFPLPLPPSFLGLLPS